MLKKGNFNVYFRYNLILYILNINNFKLNVKLINWNELLFKFNWFYLIMCVKLFWLYYKRWYFILLLLKCDLNLLYKGINFLDYSNFFNIFNIFLYSGLSINMIKNLNKPLIFFRNFRIIVLDKLAIYKYWISSIFIRIVLNLSGQNSLYWVIVYKIVKLLFFDLINIFIFFCFFIVDFFLFFFNYLDFYVFFFGKYIKFYRFMKYKQVNNFLDYSKWSLFDNSSRLILEKKNKKIKEMDDNYNRIFWKKLLKIIVINVLDFFNFDIDMKLKESKKYLLKIWDFKENVVILLNWLNFYYNKWYKLDKVNRLKYLNRKRVKVNYYYFNVNRFLVDYFFKEWILVLKKKYKISDRFKVNFLFENMELLKFTDIYLYDNFNKFFSMLLNYNISNEKYLKHYLDFVRFLKKYKLKLNLLKMMKFKLLNLDFSNKSVMEYGIYVIFFFFII